ncbi:MAG: hypothetical protein BWK73_50945 [Thiothrix lacustris]|uniref:Uncharacterized protein n=1 Tax=Thiothrix lacustris TaxID=525917 RepID=A0A1Y1Q850_9GAMM|nr:MAG: hypothetical protein BWK73_50945 [Thiothrix lacustris]
MQPKSIPEPVRVEHERTLTAFPESGNNFVTVTALNGVQDPLALLEALAFVQDCAVALAAFERLQAAKKPG